MMDATIFLALAERLSMVFLAPYVIAGTAMKFLISIRCFESTEEVVLGEHLGLYQSGPVTKTTVASIQICHFRITPQEAARITWSPAITQLLDSKKIRVSHDDNVTWATIYKLEQYPDVEPILAILTDLLMGLQSAGVKPHDKLCMTCQIREAAEPTFDGSRVSQLCPKCAEQAKINARLVETTTSEAKTAIALAAPVAVLGAGLSWAITWSLYDWLFSLIARGKKIIVLPGIMELAIMFAVAAPAAFLVSFLLRRIHGIGKTTAQRLGAACCLLGLLLGEGLFVYLSFRRDGVLLNPGDVPQAAIRFWVASGAHGIIRLVVVGLAVLLAYEFSLPATTRNNAADNTTP